MPPKCGIKPRPYPAAFADGLRKSQSSWLSSHRSNHPKHSGRGWSVAREVFRRFHMGRKLRGINPEVKPVAQACVDCSQTGGWWLQLRRCAECGHIGCCDSSPEQHARKHAEETGHPVIASFEPLQHWFYDYERERIVKGVRLLPPHAHPSDQPSPGPANRVPENWESLLHDLHNPACHSHPTRSDASQGSVRRYSWIARSIRESGRSHIPATRT